jgi:hypothetical protein
MNKKLIAIAVFFLVFFLTNLREVRATPCCTNSDCGGSPWVCVGAPNTCPDPFTGARGICKQPDGNPDHCFLGIDCMPPDECIGDVCYVSTDPVPTRPPIDYVPTTCPAGQDLSCGTATEAETQNKKTCLYRITCNKYYWPSIIVFPPHVIKIIQSVRLASRTVPVARLEEPEAAHLEDIIQKILLFRYVHKVTVFVILKIQSSKRGVTLSTISCAIAVLSTTQCF